MSAVGWWALVLRDSVEEVAGAGAVGIVISMSKGLPLLRCAVCPCDRAYY